MLVHWGAHRRGPKGGRVSNIELSAELERLRLALAATEALLEAEREHSARLRAELSEQLKETAAAQRLACAQYMERERWFTSRAALSAPLVTENEP